MAETTKPTVLVDMDNVMAEFDGGVVTYLRENHPHIPIIETRDHFYFADDYVEHAEEVVAAAHEPGFFRNLPVVDGALEGWQKLIDLGYVPRICSAPLETQPDSVNEKLGWLEEHLVPEFGKVVVETAIMDHDKYLYDGIAIIDDHPEIRGLDKAKWRHIVFSRSYNRNLPSEMRINGWRDVRLEGYLAHCALLYKSSEKPVLL